MMPHASAHLSYAQPQLTLHCIATYSKLHNLDLMVTQPIFEQYSSLAHVATQPQTSLLSQGVAEG